MLYRHKKSAKLYKFNNALFSYSILLGWSELILQNPHPILYPLLERKGNPLTHFEYGIIFYKQFFTCNCTIQFLEFSQRLLRSPRKPMRKISKIPFKVLDAPELQDDFYLNLVDWSSSNILRLAFLLYLLLLCHSWILGNWAHHDFSTSSHSSFLYYSVSAIS